KRRWAPNHFPNAITVSSVEVPGLDERVSLSLADVPLRQAMRELASQCSLAYPPPVAREEVGATPLSVYLPWILVDPRVPDVRVSVQMHGVAPQSAIWLLGGAVIKAGVPLAITKESENYILSLRAERAFADERLDPDKLVSLDLH